VPDNAEIGHANVVSEWTRPQPNPGVIRWLADQDEDRLFVSGVTLAELHHGVNRLAAGARRKRLQGWLDEELRERFEGRIVTVNEDAARVWGKLMATTEVRGKRMNLMDGFLAATALVFGLTLVTRNVADFEASGCAISSPWNART
jgi:predicted nucleic acid-binding protein